MPTVTSLDPLESDPGRLRLEVDGEAEGTLPLDRVREMGLEEGKELGPEGLDRLRGEVHAQDALERGLDYLSYRSRSRAEVERHLRSKDFSEAAVARAVERLEGLGYLDDREFAAAHVRDRIRLKPRGRKVLEKELREKGVDAETARAAIDDAFREEDVDERDLLERAAADKWRRMGGVGPEDDPRKARRRFRAYLARRGFPFHLVREVERDYFSETGPESP